MKLGVIFLVLYVALLVSVVALAAFGVHPLMWWMALAVVIGGLIGVGGVWLVAVMKRND